MAENAPLQLAEVQWTWRRWYIYALTIVLVGLVGFVIHSLTDPSALKVIGLALVGLIAFGQFLYMAGATATDIVRIVAAWKSGRPAGDDA